MSNLTAAQWQALIELPFFLVIAGTILVSLQKSRKELEGLIHDRSRSILASIEKDHP